MGRQAFDPARYLLFYEVLAIAGARAGLDIVYLEARVPIRTAPAW